MQAAESLTFLAYKHGPFFFAILYAYVMTRWAYGIYDKATDEQKRKVFRQYFWVVVVVGIVLVGVSTLWWVFSPQRPYVFKGEIRGLRDYEQIASTKLYLKHQLYPKVSEGAPQIRDAHFLIIQPDPFTDDDDFGFLFSKGGEQSQVLLSIKYVPDENPIYEIEFDPDLKANVIKRVGSSDSTSMLFREVYARGHEVAAAPAVPHFYFQTLISGRQVIEALQDERTGVGTKIAALHELTKMEDADLREMLTLPSEKEPVLLSILDLTRHSDQELAYMAQVVLDRFDISSYLKEALVSGPADKMQEAIDILYRIEPTQAVEIIEGVPTEAWSAELEQLKESIGNGDQSRVLTPTASNQGDRYYVEAEWDPADEETVQCLTNLFNSDLISNRTLEQEAQMMQGRSQRFVYWYSKAWALDVADRIEACGGNASFVNGFSLK